MESPFNRPVAANLIRDTIDQWHDATSKGVVGFSLSMQIYTVLERAQYLTESAKERDDK